MLPLLPFAAGLLTGVIGLRLLKYDKTKAGLSKAQESLREATLSSLQAIEGATARARERLAAAPVEPSAPPAPTAAPAPAEAAPAKAAAPRKSPARKPAARRKAVPAAAPSAPEAAPEVGKDEAS